MTADQETVRKFFRYERRTGMLRRVLGGRKPYPWRAMGKGYLGTTFRGRLYYLHQLVWLYHRGYIPPMLDHRDGNKKNCKIGNLRECTNAQNQYNGPRKSNNRSGFKGVVRQNPTRKCRNPWHAKITVNGQIIGLGYYTTPEAASRAYFAGAKKYAGQFARSN